MITPSGASLRLRTLSWETPTAFRSTPAAGPNADVSSDRASVVLDDASCGESAVVVSSVVVVVWSVVVVVWSVVVVVWSVVVVTVEESASVVEAEDVPSPAAGGPHVVVVRACGYEQCHPRHARAPALCRWCSGISVLCHPRHAERQRGHCKSQFVRHVVVIGWGRGRLVPRRLSSLRVLTGWRSVLAVQVVPPAQAPTKHRVEICPSRGVAPCQQGRLRLGSMGSCPCRGTRDSRRSSGPALRPPSLRAGRPCLLGLNDSPASPPSLRAGRPCIGSIVSDRNDATVPSLRAAVRRSRCATAR